MEDEHLKFLHKNNTFLDKRIRTKYVIPIYNERIQKHNEFQDNIWKWFFFIFLGLPLIGASFIAVLIGIISIFNFLFS
jgi:hypothetical protein